MYRISTFERDFYTSPLLRVRHTRHGHRGVYFLSVTEPDYVYDSDVHNLHVPRIHPLRPPLSLSDGYHPHYPSTAATTASIVYFLRLISEPSQRHFFHSYFASSSAHETPVIVSKGGPL